MVGNKRKRLNKLRSRGRRHSANRGLFVEGGFLSDWTGVNSPRSTGKKGSKRGYGGSRSGKGKGGNFDSKPGPGSGQRSQPKKSRGNTVGFGYSQENTFVDGDGTSENIWDKSNPVVRIDNEKTPIVVFLDEGPVNKSESMEYLYDYTTSFTLDQSSPRGLCFYNEVETTPGASGSSSKMEEKEGGSIDVFHSADSEMGQDSLSEMSSPEEYPGYLLIGGTKIYTHDISYQNDQNEEEEEVSDEERSGFSVSEDFATTSESDGFLYSGSDIDEEVAADYFEGIGGIGDIINVDQLVGKVPGASDDSDSDSEHSFDGTPQKFGWTTLQEASREYGMKKARLRRKYRDEDKRSSPMKYHWSSSMDDLVVIKGPRTVSGRKKHVTRPPQSCPFEASKSKKFRKISGEKKKHCKEMIAVKRRNRMIRRGVDLQQINLKLEQMVLDGTDMLSFQPMLSRDCFQVRRLASIYRLQSGSERSGKKRFVTVIRTQHTCMPSSSDKIRLEKLIRADDEDDDFTFIDGPVKVDGNAAKKASRFGDSMPLGSQPSRSKIRKALANKESAKGAKKNKRTRKVGSYAAEPLSFISSGAMNAEMVELGTTESIETNNMSHEIKGVSDSACYGAFEMHTTGFGSKMMAKMGFAGGGLGKEGQGMTQPIEVYQRPKSLGLGAEVPETSGKSANAESQAKSIGSGTKFSRTNETKSFGSFEKHTKGFGSKMMAKMGFVGGMGLGKDSQGMVNPLVAVRRAKSRGLGAMS